MSPDKRLCTVCGGAIERNLYIEGGRLYHYGCFIAEREKWFKCTECLGECNGLEAPVVDGVRTCPHCGAIGTLRNKWWWRQRETYW